MKPVFGIVWLLEATSARVLKNEDNLSESVQEVPGNFSCDIPSISTERAVLYQNFFEKKIDENGDGDLSVQELKMLNLANQDTFLQEYCNESKNMWEEVQQGQQIARDKILNNPRSKLAYKSFSNRLVSIKKDEFIDWIKVVWREEGDASLIGEFLFLFLDDDMSGELTDEENYLTFVISKYQIRSLPPYLFSKTAKPKWPTIENRNFTLASCDTFKNDTQRATLIQEISDKADKNNDGYLSAKELTVFDFAYLNLDNRYSTCYDNYRNTGWEYCKLYSHVRQYDLDENHEISGDEMCGFWKFVVDDIKEEVERVSLESLKSLTESDAYEEFSKNHSEPMTKEKFVSLIKNEWKGDEKGNFNLMGELLFMVVDEDMSGVVDTYEENYVVFALHKKFEKKNTVREWLYKLY